MRKRMFAAILIGLILALSGCGFSDGVKDGIKDGMSEEQEEDVNPLMEAEVHVDDVMNGPKDKKLGEYAYIEVPLKTMKKVTMEQYDEFCDQKVEDSSYNWVTIDFGNGSGLQFQGSTPAIATYGTLDDEKCITEAKGGVMMTGEDTYEYSDYSESSEEE